MSSSPKVAAAGRAGVTVAGSANSPGAAEERRPVLTERLKENLPDEGAHQEIPDRNEPDKLQERAECKSKE
jgi:hypothetical protein